MAGFKTILIPVDFSINTEIAIRKGVQLCGGNAPSVHLLHVPKISFAGLFGCNWYLTIPPTAVYDHTYISDNLAKWSNYAKKLRSDISVYQWILNDNSTERAIIEKARAVGADMIVIGKKSQHTLLPFLNTVTPTRVARLTGISVLTVRPGAMGATLRTVVVPVTPSVLEKKAEVINALGNRFQIYIRLLILVGKNDDIDMLQSSLVNICRLLKNRSLDNISYEVLTTDKKKPEILKYCRRVDADLLIIQPEGKVKFPWFHKYISDELPANSKTLVLTVGQEDSRTA